MINRKLGVIVQEWLRNNGGECVCDDCIAKSIEEIDEKAVTRVTARISSESRTEFSKYRAKCGACGRAVLTTRAKPTLTWA